MKKANLQKSSIIHFTLPNQFIIPHVRWNNPHKIFCHCFFVLKRNKHQQNLWHRSAEVKLEFKKSSSFFSMCFCFALCVILPWKKEQKKNLKRWLETENEEGFCSWQIINYGKENFFICCDLRKMCLRRVSLFLQLCVSKDVSVNLKLRLLPVILRLLAVTFHAIHIQWGRFSFPTPVFLFLLEQLY